MNDVFGKRMWTFLIALAAGTLCAVEGNLVPTLSQNLEDQWGHILPKRPPQLSTVSAVVPGQPFSVRLILGRFALKDGAADVTVDLDQVNPDGTVKAIGHNLAAFRKKSSADGVFLADFLLEIIMEEKDQPGDYKIIARLRDNNDGSEKQLEAPFRLVAPPATYPEVDLRKDGAVLSNYYRSPQPEQLPGLLKAVLRERPLEDKTLSLYYGLGLLFRLNPQLHGELVRIAAAQSDPAARRGAAAVVHFLDETAQEQLRPQLDPETIKQLDNLEGIPSAPPQKIRNGGQLDQLWMEFFATGKVEPIRRLVNELSRPGGSLSPEAFKAKKDKGEATPEDLEKLLNFLITMAANWSLGSNAKQHPLVAYYLEAMLVRNEIKDPQAAALVKEILRKASVPPAAPRQ